mmetsp:Transcript_117504/g.252591  ORF Transcript_117504/g.252591 Transcript_117504/m.252591 type:complete len:275 (+) Transcript_117504:672-1496(+)
MHVPLAGRDRGGGQGAPFGPAHPPLHAAGDHVRQLRVRHERVPEGGLRAPRRRDESGDLRIPGDLRGFSDRLVSAELPEPRPPPVPAGDLLPRLQRCPSDQQHGFWRVVLPGVQRVRRSARQACDLLSGGVADRHGHQPVPPAEGGCPGQGGGGRRVAGGMPKGVFFGGHPGGDQASCQGVGAWRARRRGHRGRAGRGLHGGRGRAGDRPGERLIRPLSAARYTAAALPREGRLTATSSLIIEARLYRSQVPIRPYAVQRHTLATSGVEACICR